MPEKSQLPRLTRRDVVRILDGHNAIMTVRGALDRSSFAAGRALSASLLLVDMLLCELYNRAESAFQVTAQAGSENGSQGGQLEPDPIAEAAPDAYAASGDGK
jgi:hypothetical protein